MVRGVRHASDWTKALLGRGNHSASEKEGKDK